MTERTRIISIDITHLVREALARDTAASGMSDAHGDWLSQRGASHETPPP